MRFNALPFILAGLYVPFLIAMNTTPRLTIEQYKEILAAGDCQKIVETTQLLWPRKGDVAYGEQGLYIEWNDNILLLVKGEVAAPNVEEYRQALHDFIYEDILKPAMGGIMSIDVACGKIDQLAGTCKTTINQKHWDGILNINFTCFSSEELPNKAASSMKLAICKARGIAHTVHKINPADCVDASTIDNLIRITGPKALSDSIKKMQSPTPIWKRLWWAPLIILPCLAAVGWSSWKVYCYCMDIKNAEDPGVPNSTPEQKETNPGTTPPVKV